MGNDVSVPGRCFPHPDSLFVPQPVATGAEGHQIICLIGSTLLSRHDVVHLQKPRSVAAGGLATVLVSCEYLPAHSWRDGGRVATTVFADCGIAAHSFGFGFTQLAFTCVGLDGHTARFRIFLDVDLHRRSA